MPIAVGTPKNSKDSPKGIGFRLNDRSNSTRTTGPRFGWLKGLVLMLLPGPANGLLLKLAHVAAVSGLGEISSLFGGVVKFLTAAAVLSVLLTIDYASSRGSLAPSARPRARRRLPRSRSWRDW
jgi:hypothetical protein